MKAEYLVPLIERQSLSKKTFHLRLDLQNTDIEYAPGDCIGVFAPNNRDAVQELVAYLKEPFSADALTKVNISAAAPRLFKHFQVPEKPPQEHTLVEALIAFGLKPSIQDIVTHQPPLLPRMYSIASSQAFGRTQRRNVVDLLVSCVCYEERGKVRLGVASSYLCLDIPLFQPLIRIYHHKSDHFHLPADHKTPCIAIGPGTGVAPFRSFAQEKSLGQSGLFWLFFGEKNKASDFYYESEWSDLGVRLTTAFSRDQNHKIYVQDRLKEHCDEVVHLLHNGAHIYVCGDAKKMAKDVENTLIDICQSRDFVRSLRKEGRYQRDVY